MDEKQEALEAIRKLGNPALLKAVENNFKESNLKISLDRIITQDETMIKLKEVVKKLALVNSTVLIQGETGTGKELIARALHGDRTGRFVPVNCTALPSELIESELFGHERGSFTGAHAFRIGKFEAAQNGTLFLDEVGDMPLDMQTKLLRVLQDKTFSRIGSNVELKTNCRVVCATNQVVREKIREDLYYRISVFELRTLPLRDRINDINLIASHLFGADLNMVELLKNSNRYLDDINFLRGNVRELINLVERFKVLGEI